MVLYKINGIFPFIFKLSEIKCIIMEKMLGDTMNLLMYAIGRIYMNGKIYTVLSITVILPLSKYVL